MPDPEHRRVETSTDTVWPRLAQGLAATLGCDDPGGGDGMLPPLWHWMLFQAWVPAADLAEDGHPRRGGFLPPTGLSRRMWAGGRVHFPGRLRIGEAVTRTSSVASVAEKTGASGRLLFVTIRHELASEAGVAVVEEQDIVFRGVAGEAVKRVEAARPPPAGAVQTIVRPDTVMLFRYSALTGNGHRIHYDLDYVTRVEGYPGLLVHGPLQATLLLGLAERVAGRLPTGFAYRARRPAFHDRALTLTALADGDAVRVDSRDETGAVCMSGEASFA